MSEFDNSVPLAGVGKGLDAALDAAFEKLNITDQSFEPAPPPPLEPDEPQETEAASTEEDDAGVDEKAKQKERQRDPKGKFATPDPKGKTAVTQPSAKPLDAPAAPGHWSTQRRDAFGKLPAETQKTVLDFTKESEAAITRLANENARYKPLAEGIRSALTDRHREQLRAAGTDEVGGIKQLLKYHDMATENPAGYVRMVMQNARLDPRQVFKDYLTGEQPNQPAQPGQAQPAALHPQIVQALQTIAGRVQNIEKTQTEGQRLQQEAETNRLVRLVTDFETEAGSDGNPLRPHFDAVRSQVFEQLHAPSVRDIADPRERLQRAYEIAVYGDPNLRGTLVASEAQRLAAEQRQKDEVAKARRAKPLNLNGTKGPTQGPRVNTLDDALAQTRRQLGI